MSCIARRSELDIYFTARLSKLQYSSFAPLKNLYAVATAKYTVPGLCSIKYSYVLVYLADLSVEFRHLVVERLRRKAPETQVRVEPRLVGHQRLRRHPRPPKARHPRSSFQVAFEPCQGLRLPARPHARLQASSLKPWIQIIIIIISHENLSNYCSSYCEKMTATNHVSSVLGVNLIYIHTAVW